MSVSASFVASRPAGTCQLLKIRGIPVRFDGEALHAVRFGHFPISSTGYRSLAHFGAGAAPSATELERMAQDADKERASVLHRLRADKAIRARTPDERFSAFITLKISIASAVGQAFLAPPAEQDKLLREVATASSVLKPFLEPGYAKPFLASKRWTTEMIVDQAREFHNLCALTCRLLHRLSLRGQELDRLAWAAFVDALPGSPVCIIVPGVLLRLLGRHDPDEEQMTSSEPTRAEIPSSVQDHEDVGSTSLAPPNLAAVEPSAWSTDKRGQLCLF